MFCFGARVVGVASRGLGKAVGKLARTAMVGGQEGREEGAAR